MMASPPGSKDAAVKPLMTAHFEEGFEFVSHGVS